MLIMASFGELFTSTLTQMIVLFVFMAVGFILRKTNTIKEGAIPVLSKLISTIFLPAVLLATFAKQFTVDNLKTNGWVLLFSACVSLITVTIGILVGKLIIKEKSYLRGLYQYSLIFSNFSYVAIPIVKACFPAYEMHYLVFTIVPQFVFVFWALPNLLIPKAENAEEEEKPSLGKSILLYLKKLLNPIFIGLFTGIILGLTGLGPKLFASDNQFVAIISSVINTSGSCMSPTAMLLTGIVIGSYSFASFMKDKRIYYASAFRLVIIPLVLGFILKGIILLFSIADDTAIWMMICLLLYTAMPLGLNTVIIPSAYGKDSVDGAGMAFISSVIGIITIPLILALFLII